jgi:hypothetical protein
MEQIPIFITSSIEKIQSLLQILAAQKVNFTRIYIQLGQT